jgi:uncharacterized protein YoxC
MAASRLLVPVFLILILGLYGCGKSEDLKKQIQEKDQRISALEAEVKKTKEDFAAKEQEIRSDAQARVQKLNVSHRQQVEDLKAKIAELSEEKKKSTKPAAKTPATPKKRRTTR